MATPPPIPNEALYASPRQVKITALAADLDVNTTYGGPTRSVIVGGSGNFVYEPSSPQDPASASISWPVTAGQELGFSIRKILASTDAAVLPILLVF